MQIFAVLGSHPSLSIAEISEVTDARPIAQDGIVALFDDINGDLPTLLNTLGGTQKMGHVIGELPLSEITKLTEFLVAQLEHEHRESKMHFGLSIYDYGNPEGVKQVAGLTSHIGLSVKNALKDLGRSSRYVMAKGEALNAVAVMKNELIKKGAEFVLLVGKDTVTIGTTAAVQDAEDWSNRDFGRPRRNAKQGMLPPKLARIMINLSGKRAAGATLLDPFCGSGTVLMEGAMLGAGKLVGGDIATGAVHDTQHNLSWLKTQNIAVPEVEVHVAKAGALAEKVAPNSVDLLVTETYLGAPRRGNEALEDIMKGIEYIETMYEESFGPLRNTLKGDAVVVIAAPVHFFEGRTFEPNIEKVLSNLGYFADPIGSEPLIYHREDQLVGRHFHRFRATPPKQGGPNNAAIFKKMKAEQA